MSLRTDQERFSILPISSIAAASMLLMAALQAMPVTWQHAIRYDRGAIEAGQWWRLLSAHFVHLNWSHLALNLAGLGLGTWLFGADRSPGRWMLATLLAAAGCGLGLYWFTPSVGWCVGLSGVLHGLMVVGFGGWVLAGDRWAALLLTLVVGKMAWEQFGGDMPWTGSMVGGTVITAAHVWGAVGGVLYLTGEAIWYHWRPQV